MPTQAEYERVATLHSAAAMGMASTRSIIIEQSHNSLAAALKARATVADLWPVYLIH